MSTSNQICQKCGKLIGAGGSQIDGYCHGHAEDSGHWRGPDGGAPQQSGPESLDLESLLDSIPPAQNVTESAGDDPDITLPPGTPALSRAGDRPASQFQGPNQAPAPPSTPAGGLKAQLDSIPTPGAAHPPAPQQPAPSATPEPGGLKAQLDSIPTPGAAQPAPPQQPAPAATPEPGGLKAQLDSIPTPGAAQPAAPQQPAPAATPEPGGLKAQLDSIPTPGAAQPAAPQQPAPAATPEPGGLKAQLDSIPTPGAAQPAAPQQPAPATTPEPGGLKAQLDSIPTPGGESGATQERQGPAGQMQPSSGLQAQLARRKSQNQLNKPAELNSQQVPESQKDTADSVPAAPPVDSAAAMKAELDTIATPGTAPSAMKDQLDSIPTPGGDQQDYQEPSSDSASLSAQLDAIPTPKGVEAGMPQKQASESSPAASQDSPEWMRRYDSLSGAPAGEDTQGELELKSALDSIPTPGGAQEGNPPADPNAPEWMKRYGSHQSNVGQPEAPTSQPAASGDAYETPAAASGYGMIMMIMILVCLVLLGYFMINRNPEPPNFDAQPSSSTSK